MRKMKKNTKQGNNEETGRNWETKGINNVALFY